MSENTQVAQVPAHIMARIAARGGAKSALLDAVVSGESYPKISIRASRYRLVDAGQETVVGIELDVVFVAVNPKVSKVWYAKPYSADSDDKSPPDCWSNDGVRPDASVTSPFHDNCAQCPNNVLGSKKTPQGKDTKICNDIRYIAVVPAADPSKVYGLTVPVSAMKDFRLYFKELANYGLNPEEVVTTLGFDDKASFPKMTFKQKGYVPEKHLAAIESMGTSPEALAVIRTAPSTPRIANPAVAKPALSVVQTPAAEAPAPEPVVPTDEPVEAAPPPKAAAKAAKPAKAAEPAPAAPAASVDDELGKQLDDLFA